MKLYLDQDGPLADFDAKKKEIFGTDKVPDHILWHVINKYFPTYFEDLPPAKGMMDLWNFCKQYNPIILTAIPKANLNRIDLQKRKWLDKYLGTNVPMITCRRAEKQNYAAPNSILIDDNEKNCKEWKEMGGHAILYISANQTIRYFYFLLDTSFPTLE